MEYGTQEHAAWSPTQHTHQRMHASLTRLIGAPCDTQQNNQHTSEKQLPTQPCHNAAIQVIVPTGPQLLISCPCSLPTSKAHPTPLTHPVFLHTTVQSWRVANSARLHVFVSRQSPAVHCNDAPPPIMMQPGIMQI